MTYTDDTFVRFRKFETKVDSGYMLGYREIIRKNAIKCPLTSQIVVSEDQSEEKGNDDRINK